MIVDDIGIGYELEEGQIPFIKNYRSPENIFLSNGESAQIFIAKLFKVNPENIFYMRSSS